MPPQIQAGLPDKKLKSHMITRFATTLLSRELWGSKLRVKRIQSMFLGLLSREYFECRVGALRSL